MKLYQEVDNSDVLEKVIALVDEAQKTLFVVEGEDDNHEVQPDDKYFQAVQAFLNRGGKVYRYYFGTQKAFLNTQADNPEIIYYYCGGMENYQRAVIADGIQTMAKIGHQFVYSKNPLWVKMLQDYFGEFK